MDLYDAYLKARDDAKRRNYTLLTGSWDYGDFWGFLFIPPTDEELNGIAAVTVNKETGKIGYFLPQMDFDLYEKAKPIPIEQFAEKAAVA